MDIAAKVRFDPEDAETAMRILAAGGVRSSFVSASTVLALSSYVGDARANTVADFYRGKSISSIIQAFVDPMKGPASLADAKKRGYK